MNPNELRELADLIEGRVMRTYEQEAVATERVVAYLREQAERMEQAEPVAKVIRNAAGQISMQTPDGAPFDMLKFVGQTLYAHAPAPQSVPEGGCSFPNCQSKEYQDALAAQCLAELWTGVVVPPGHWLAPMEPTQEIVNALAGNLRFTVSPDGRSITGPALDWSAWCRIYRAMRDAYIASPAAPAEHPQLMTSDERYARFCKPMADALMAAAPAETPREDWQQRCLDVGFQYVRASDDHYVECTQAQAAELLRDVLGVDVHFKDAAPAAPAPADAVEALLRDAVPIVQAYARANPIHHFGGGPQDPCGAHAWLARVALVAADQKAAMQRATDIGQDLGLYESKEPKGAAPCT